MTEQTLLEQLNRIEECLRTESSEGTRAQLVLSLLEVVRSLVIELNQLMEGME